MRMTQVLMIAVLVLAGGAHGSAQSNEVKAGDTAAVTGTGRAQDAQAARASAEAVMHAARQALGGASRIAAVKGLAIRGSYRRESASPPGNGGMVTITMNGPGPAGGPEQSTQQTGNLEIDVEFPDRFIRVDAGTGAMAMTRIEGYEGDRPFADLTSNQPGLRVSAGPPEDDPAARQAALRRSQGELARLLLGIMAGTQPSFPVSYSYAGQAESPDGRADVVDVTGPDRFAARLFLDAQSHLPLMLTFMAPEPRMMIRTTREGGPPERKPRESGAMASPGQGPGVEGPPPGRSVADADPVPPKMVEHRLFFSDFREVDGLSLPHRIARGMGEKVTEEWDITSYKVNPTLKVDRFKVGR